MRPNGTPAASSPTTTMYLTDGVTICGSSRVPTARTTSFALAAEHESAARALRALSTAASASTGITAPPAASVLAASVCRPFQTSFSAWSPYRSPNRFDAKRYRVLAFAGLAASPSTPPPVAGGLVHVLGSASRPRAQRAAATARCCSRRRSSRPGSCRCRRPARRPRLPRPRDHGCRRRREQAAAAFAARL